MSLLHFAGSLDIPHSHTQNQHMNIHHPTNASILTCSNQGVEVVRIAPDGRIFWRGREVETDADFRLAMLELAEVLKGTFRANTGSNA